MATRTAINTVIRSLMGTPPVIPEGEDFTLRELGETARVLTRMGVNRMVVSYGRAHCGSEYIVR